MAASLVLNGGHVRRRDGDQPALVQCPAARSCEIEGAVARMGRPGWPHIAPAWTEAWCWRGDGGVEALVADVAIQVAM